MDGTFLSQAAATRRDVVLANQINDYTGGVADVPLGARIRFVYLFVQCISTGTGTANHDWYVYKRPGVALTTTPMTPGTIGGNKARKFVLHEEKGIPGNSGDGAYPLTFKGVIKIPYKMQRWGEDDELLLVHISPDTSNLCIKCIYRWSV